MTNERDRAIDITKGIAIILMVIGHCYHETNIVQKVIYAFHMPLFFMISGILYAEKQKIDLAKQLRVLLIPYFSFETIYVILISLMGSRGNIVSLSGIFFEKIKSTVLLIGANVCWYLPCLLIAEVIFVCLKKICNKWLHLVISFVLLYGGVSLSILGYSIEIVLKRAMVAQFFFVVGYYGKEKIWMKDSFLGAIVAGIVFSVAASKNSFVSMVTSDYGSIPLFLLSSLCGSYLLLALGRWIRHGISSMDVVKNFLIGYGENTLIILCTHMLYVEIIRFIDYKIFGNVLNKLGIFEGIVFAAILIPFLSITVWFINRYCSYLIGKSGRKKKDAKHSGAGV